MGKVFYLEVRLWVNTTVKNICTRLIVHGGHYEQSWVSDTEPETIMALSPIVFASFFDAMKGGRQATERDQIQATDTEQDPTSKDLLEASAKLARETERARMRGQLMRELRKARGLPERPISMPEHLALGVSHLRSTRGIEFQPPILWSIDELEPVRVLLTVTCLFDCYNVLAYLAQVLGSLLRDFRTAEIEHVRHFTLEEMPEDLRAYYLDAMAAIGGSEQPPLEHMWGPGGRLPEHARWYGRRPEMPAADATQRAVAPQLGEMNRQVETGSINITTFILDISADDFAAWLSAKWRAPDWATNIPSGIGTNRLQMRGLRDDRRKNDGPRQLTATGMWITEDADKAFAHVQDDLIVFTLLPLDPERVEVQIECRADADEIMAFMAGLLVHTSRRWPQIRRNIRGEYAFFLHQINELEIAAAESNREQPAEEIPTDELELSQKGIGKNKQERMEYRRKQVQSLRARVPKTTIEDIAEQLGCSEITVKRDLKALGIK